MPSATLGRAVEYIRMSTDAQDLSPAVQRVAVGAYAASHSLDITESDIDAARSGLTLHKRLAMKKLLADVTSDSCLFSIILVYDISRGGRLQDTHASAYYECQCRLHGVDVRYVQKPFQPRGTPLDALYKGMKRVMAAEFSRERAMKTVAGQSAAMDRGFHLGSPPCIGVSRVAVAKHTGEHRALGPTEHKTMNREHVMWTRGTEEEVELVRMLFHLYATSDLSVSQLATQLAAEGHKASDGHAISRWRIGSHLTNEVFIGNFVCSLCLRVTSAAPRWFGETLGRAD